MDPDQAFHALGKAASDAAFSGSTKSTMSRLLLAELPNELFATLEIVENWPSHTHPHVSKLRLVVVDGEFQLATLPHTRSKHARRVEAPNRPTIRSDSDKTSLAMQFRQP
jgi:hypothetical protein